MTEAKVHISYHISKLGEKIPSVNLPAGLSCRPDAPCAKDCYAKHGRFIFNNVKTPMMNNWNIWKTDPERYEKEVLIAAYFSKWFRWHSSGDIPDERYMEMIPRIAENLPGTKFLCFTKQAELVNDYLNHHTKPDNLSLVLSAWGDWIPENPHGLPMSYVRLKNSPCDIPANAFECGGFCGKCIWTDKNCWDMKPGECVVFNQH